MPTRPPPSKFEISDLGIPESDPRYAAAVRCVKTYWKQATCMTESQIIRYLGYLHHWNLSKYIPTSSQMAKPDSRMARASTHELYPKRSAKGALVKYSTCWTGYMLLSSLYDELPPEYVKIIRECYGRTTIEDHTDEYRCLYPAPTAKQGITPPVIDITTPIIDITVPAETSTATTTTTQSTASGAWSIDNVVDIMCLSDRKRLCSGSVASMKRAKVDSNEMLKKVNQQAEIIQEAIESLQEKQETKLREMREAIEENKQAVTTMQGELRQFMSAVATTLRDIQERLDE